MGGERRTLRRFSNSREVLRGVPGGVFLGKTPLNVRGSALHQLENRYRVLGANSAQRRVWAARRVAGDTWKWRRCSREERQLFHRGRFLARTPECSSTDAPRPVRRPGCRSGCRGPQKAPLFPGAGNRGRAANWPRRTAAQTLRGPRKVQLRRWGSILKPFEGLSSSRTMVKPKMQRSKPSESRANSGASFSYSKRLNWLTMK